MGKVDERSIATQQRLANDWDEFTKRKLFLKKKQSLTWDRIFTEIGHYIQEGPKPIRIIFDEIQWIAKEGNGFIGTIKQYWLGLEQNKKTRLIICGSSNKFYKNKTGGEEKILRGIKTHSALWIEPFTLTEITKFYTHKWPILGTFFAYLTFGGIPYYWNQLDCQNGCTI
jgi:hypothetical protein